MVHFLAPPSSASILDELIETKLGQNYPYWLGGAINWVVQSYLVLREYREGISISNLPKQGQINFAHVTTWRAFPRRQGEYRVSIRADYRRLFDVDFEILQNPTRVQTSNQIYLPYWPIPGLLPRDEKREIVENIAYAGRIGNRNIAKSLQSSGFYESIKGAKFCLIDKQSWHDMREVDILIAVRDFSTRAFDNKPPSKLLNAWHAGIPLVAGYDSAFSQIGKPGIDYIRVKTEQELKLALEKLLDDPRFYYSIVEAGKTKRGKYSHENIAKYWLQALDGPIYCDWQRKKINPRVFTLSLSSRRVTDFILNNASTVKKKSINMLMKK